MSRSGSGAVLSASALKIGQEATGSVTLGSALKLVVYKNTDNSAADKLYDGSLSGFTSASLGTFAASGSAGDSHAFYVHVSLPTTGTDAGDNALQGATASASFTWSAVQA